ncbi:hypothetical protein EA187_03595 [Lujinxingia sediminis]|uniref:Uncharacterized protein n=1 Tax=Lujinxingia sediminis TaxID=2480984 RepID=A0ABY0CY33_9DELT|nr:hypothetical protein [Lujinxingia sediminis]RVU48529.1 hypothetical protein EA187_03595 [Lujinxingia sediminis]
MNALRHILLIVSLLLSPGCGGAFTSTIVRTDGATLETVPSCVTLGADGMRMLRGTGLGDGIAASNVETIRSHAGMESVGIGTTAVVLGTALMIWFASDQPRSGTTWRLATGGALAGLGLINAIVGGVMWSRSASALSSLCHPRATIPR